MGEGGALGLGALCGRHGCERGGAYGVMGVAGERFVGPRDPAGDQIEQGRRDDRRVDVDTGQVQGAAARGRVEFRAGRRAASGPAGGVPAVTEKDPVVRAGGGEVPYGGEGRVEGGSGGQVQAGEGETGGRGVDMGVGERGGDERAVQVDDLVHPLGEGVGGTFGTHPGDLSALDDHRGRERIGGAVDLPAAEEDGAGGGSGAFTHEGQFRASRAAACRQGAQILGGRASYGVDSTTVVRVETPASDLTRASSSSSSCGVATRTLRM